MKPTWETLHRIRKLDVSRFASWTIVVVPFLASAHLAILQHLHVNLPLPTNLFVIYLSTILFFATSLLIDLYCPHEIKDHGDFESFFQFVTHKTETISAARTQSNSRREARLDKIAQEASPEVMKQEASPEVMKQEASPEVMKQEASPEVEKQPASGHQLSTLLDNFFFEEADIAFLALAATAWTTADEKWPIIRWTAATGFLLSAIAALYVSLYDAPRRVLMVLA